MKTIGVLTSGGDAPGMNAAIRAVVRTAVGRGVRILGIEKGFKGIFEEEIHEMSAEDGTSRGNSVPDGLRHGLGL